MYKIFYKDGTIFQGGEYYDSKWNDMPKKPIQKLEYKLNGKTVIMENYSAYNHHFERISRLGKGEIHTKVILMARKKEDVLLLIYDIRKKKFDYDVAEIGKEYNNKPVTGWKEGIKNGKPKCQII